MQFSFISSVRFVSSAFLILIVPICICAEDASASDQLKAGIQRFEPSIQNMEPDDIQASNSTRPLDRLLWRGNVFDKEQAEKLLKDKRTTSNFWYRVPSWSAGRWESSDATTMFMRDHKSGITDRSQTTYQFRGRETIGHQFDKQHGIWTFCRENVWTHGQSNGTEIRSLLFYQRPLRVTANEIVVLGRMAVFEVNPKGKITGSYKTEVLDTMTPNGGTGMNDKQIKIVFDEQGNSVTTIEAEVNWRRLTDFQPINDSNGVALKPLFSEYLKARGLSNLIDE